jgi:hypothetical protein
MKKRVIYGESNYAALVGEQGYLVDKTNYIAKLDIDEYDNFANQLITSHQDMLYRQLVASDGFLKTFFKTLKAGRESGAVVNIFITGVLPITIDELASAFNIDSFLTLVPAFEGMLGFKG